MHIIITDAWLAKSRAIHLDGWRMLVVMALVAAFLVLSSFLFYHWVFLKGVREGWPVFGSIAKIVTRGEVELRDTYLRENLEIMARKVGELQARMLQIESLGERVAGLAGLTPEEVRSRPAQGGALMQTHPLSMQELAHAMEELDRSSAMGFDWLIVVESRLFDQKVQRSLIPTEVPVINVSVGSRFGFRMDPFTGRSAFHPGLDFPADVGTPIMAAAGGVVVTQEYHYAYGNMLEIDHGNDLVTRYAHASRTHVRKGDIVRRGQHIADVGSTGRSTGPHLHFEVLVAGVPQDPQRFLLAEGAAASATDVSSGERLR